MPTLSFTCQRGSIYTLYEVYEIMNRRGGFLYMKTAFPFLYLLFFLFNYHNNFRFMFQQTLKVLKGFHQALQCLKQTFISGDCGVNLVRLVSIVDTFFSMISNDALKRSCLFCCSISEIQYTTRILLANQDTLLHLQLDTLKRQTLMQQ